MTVEEAVREFGSGRKLCLSLGLSVQNYTRWRKQKWIPQSQQLKIEKLTDGKLIADDFGPDRKPLRINS